MTIPEWTESSNCTDSIHQWAIDVAINTVKSIEAGYKITQRNVQQQSNHALQQEASSRDSMEVLTATLEKLLLKREEEKYPIT